MIEKAVIVDKQKLTYEGIFNRNDLHVLIMNWLEKKGYERREKSNIDVVKEEGRYIEMVMRPFKNLTEYSQSILKIKYTISHMKEIVVEKDGHKIKTNQGKIDFIFDCVLETDYESRWERKAGLFFMRILFDKYLFMPFSKDLGGIAQGDFQELIKEIKSFLNLNRYLTE